ncbi:sulfatase-like hydrolase/transferase [Halosquirtibacter laminarini]|uniref:Sulfatase-like hydrolase/transferase n=1 Tax=Halosquirtibacter laminarini TaxID=3374600 RepID=A0AC61NCX5_9BACT|nr:sulfatase-like hydrolase/transferase [Prolixibacteraceae bacterium]
MKLNVVARLFVGLGAIFTSTCSIAQQKQPNIIFVFPDQMRGEAMGFEDEVLVKTPSLDQFKSEAVNFTQAIANYPVCSPTRAMIFSGLYPIKNKVTLNVNSETEKYGVELQKDAVCWSDILASNGYDLGYVGKWHLDSPREPYIKCKNNVGKMKWNEWCSPDRRHGFSYWHAYGTYDYHLNPMYWDTDSPRNGFKFYNEWGPIHEANKAIEYIKNTEGKYRDGSKPFALVVSINPPHTPYSQVPQKYKDIYKDLDVEKLCTKPSIEAKGTKWGDHYRRNIKNYYACISGVDEQFGRILKSLKDQGIDDNTIVVFTSDHGDCMGIHEKITKNNWFEESMRVPFIVKVPGVTEGDDVDYQLGSLDIYPTLLGLLGMADKVPSNLKGYDYTSVIHGEKAKDAPSHQWYMRMVYGTHKKGSRGVRNERYTFVINRMKGEGQKILLYDRKKDPFQMKNIADKNKRIVRKMETILREDLKKYNDPFVIK